MKREQVLLGIIMLAILLPLWGCKKNNNEEPITLPATSVLSVQSKWGVITSNHLRLRNEPSVETGEAVTTFWRSRGFVLEILSKTSTKMEVEGKEDFWYRIHYDGLYGWVFGGYVEIFETREAAEEAARRMAG